MFDDDDIDDLLGDSGASFFFLLTLWLTRLACQPHRRPKRQQVALCRCLPPRLPRPRCVFRFLLLMLFFEKLIWVPQVAAPAPVAAAAGKGKLSKASDKDFYAAIGKLGGDVSVWLLVVVGLSPVSFC